MLRQHRLLAARCSATPNRIQPKRVFATEAEVLKQEPRELENSLAESCFTGHSYRSAQTIVKHYRARNVDRADAGIDRLELQVRKEGMKG
jgi:hypothetical protein